MVLLLRHDSLCQGHHVRLLHPVRFAGTSPPDPRQTPGISPPRACPVINLVAIAFFSITYELPNLQALCFDIHTKCRGVGGSPLITTPLATGFSNFSAAPNSSPFQS